MDLTIVVVAPINRFFALSQVAHLWSCIPLSFLSFPMWLLHLFYTPTAQNFFGWKNKFVFYCLSKRFFILTCINRKGSTPGSLLITIFFTFCKLLWHLARNSVIWQHWQAWHAGTARWILEKCPVKNYFVANNTLWQITPYANPQFFWTILWDCKNEKPNQKIWGLA